RVAVPTCVELAFVIPIVLIITRKLTPKGQDKGWTVVEPVRDYLNEMKRSCMLDGCSLVGNYNELKKHMRAEHPSANPFKSDAYRTFDCFRSDWLNINNMYGFMFNSFYVAPTMQILLVAVVGLEMGASRVGLAQ
ncbi:hypothetical protein L195_g006834, partial [Trifolium pratense]